MKTDDLVRQAQDAAAAGELQKAIDLLTQALDERPSFYAYNERARIRLEQGDEAGALADCQAGLQLDPENSDLIWLQAELQKAPGDRFSGDAAEPPSANK
ncbi:MAG: hypothetical protein KDA63_05535 [Planctomycetales bacterium]|nr:hypothetical protein [Planctomycetales bacterium]